MHLGFFNLWFFFVPYTGKLENRIPDIHVEWAELG